MRLSKKIHIQRNDGDGNWFATFTVQDIANEELMPLIEKLPKAAAEGVLSGSMTAKKSDKTEGTWTLTFTIKDIADSEGVMQLEKNLPSLMAKATGNNLLEEYS